MQVQLWTWTWTLDSPRKKIADIAAKRNDRDGLITLDELLKNKVKSIVPIRLPPVPQADTDSSDEELDEPAPLLDVDGVDVKEMIMSIKDELVLIWSGKRKSVRHNKYKSGGVERRSLNFMMAYGPFPEEFVYKVCYELLQIFSQDMNYFDYTMKVLLSEAESRIVHMMKQIRY